MCYLFGDSSPHLYFINKVEFGCTVTIVRITISFERNSKHAYDLYGTNPHVQRFYATKIVSFLHYQYPMCIRPIQLM